MDGEEAILDRDVIIATDEQGNELQLEVLDYFFYNGEEYAILAEYTDDELTEDEAETDAGSGENEYTAADCYVMKIVESTDENGEEIEEFLTIEDAALEERLIEIAATRMKEDEEPEDED